MSSTSDGWSTTGETATTGERLGRADGAARPIGLAAAKGDFASIRRFAERDHKNATARTRPQERDHKNIVQWHTYESGGHYAAHMTSTVYADDVREFFMKVTG
ncbi:hypothetical protein ACFXJ8_10950 [Nonomuraea sp. NPDC059194]|uniref:hypothetical protein n=1 Tax=Nonomuraea sp. NPDC059194 TaxID=3346764 RepID=UPI003693E9BA